MNLADTYQGQFLAFTTLAQDSIRHHLQDGDLVFAKEVCVTTPQPHPTSYKF